jgi:predicted transcriptional regulator YdeE
MKLMGTSCRTTNAAEMNPATAQIGATIQKYQALLAELKLSLETGKTYFVYTAYESDITGAYTCFIGHERADYEEAFNGLDTLSVPPQKYSKFTAGPGNSQQVSIETWQKIWMMKPAELGGARAYLADLEIYDERAIDPEYTVLDILIGIK